MLREVFLKKKKNRDNCFSIAAYFELETFSDKIFNLVKNEMNLILNNTLMDFVEICDEM